MSAVAAEVGTGRRCARPGLLSLPVRAQAGNSGGDELAGKTRLFDDASPKCTGWLASTPVSSDGYHGAIASQAGAVGHAAADEGHGLQQLGSVEAIFLDAGK